MIKKDDFLVLSRKDELALKSPSNLAFMPYFFVQTNFPYTEVEGREFVRKNGNLTLSLYSPTGLPYGSLPRLVIAFIVTEAIRKKTREVHLGETLSEFLTRIGLGRTGGKNGTITRLRKQLNSLFTCFISCTSNWKHKGGGNIKSIANMLIADEADLWWDPHTLYDESGEFCSYVILSESFYNAINKAPIPVDFNAVLKLKKSPMAVDIYCWATYRMCYCHSRTFIPWEDLALQFGSNYKEVRVFKFYFKKHIVSVQKIYPDFKCDTSDPKGLVIFPSKTSIKKTK